MVRAASDTPALASQTSSPTRWTTPARRSSPRSASSTRRPAGPSCSACGARSDDRRAGRRRRRHPVRHRAVAGDPLGREALSRPTGTAAPSSSPLAGSRSVRGRTGRGRLSARASPAHRLPALAGDHAHDVRGLPADLPAGLRRTVTELDLSSVPTRAGPRSADRSADSGRDGMVKRKPDGSGSESGAILTVAVSSSLPQTTCAAENGGGDDPAARAERRPGSGHGDDQPLRGPRAGDLRTRAAGRDVAADPLSHADRNARHRRRRAGHLDRHIDSRAPR